MIISMRRHATREEIDLVIQRIADFGYVLQNGRIAMSGRPSELLADSALVSRYLG